MSSPSRVRNRTRYLLAILCLIPLAAACGVERDPSEYGDAYRENFMLGCTGLDENGDVPNGGEKLASKSYCDCVYEGLEEKIPFEEAKEFEEAQSQVEDDSDIEIPDNIQSVFDDCEGA